MILFCAQFIQHHFINSQCLYKLQTDKSKPISVGTPPGFVYQKNLHACAILGQGGTSIPGIVSRSMPLPTEAGIEEQVLWG